VSDLVIPGWLIERVLAMSAGVAATLVVYALSCAFVRWLFGRRR
jgi:hypothetical protein